MRVYYENVDDGNEVVVKERTTKLPNKHKKKNLLHHFKELFKSLYNYIAWEIKNK